MYSTVLVNSGVGLGTRTYIKVLYISFQYMNILDEEKVKAINTKEMHKEVFEYAY